MQTAQTRPETVPRLSAPRLAAGAFAGLVGGVAFGVLMILPAITGAGLESMGMMTLLSRLLGSPDLPVLWVIHVVNSAVFGVIFALFVAPRGGRRVVLLGLAWGVLLWLVGAFLLLRLLTGEPLALTAAVLYNLLGHLAYGAVLGLTYAAFFREEVGLLRDRGLVRGARRRGAPKP